MKLNTLSPAVGSKKNAKRVGRGIGCGYGKTCGRGHKGQKSRSGGGSIVGFEGGQMPLQRRLPKIGFSSRVGRTMQEVRLSELTMVEGDQISVETLKAAGVIRKSTTRAKIVSSGVVDKAVTLKGVGATKGARAAIEAAGGKIEE